MNEQQLARWKQLSLGLARSAYPKLTDARKRKLLREIDTCINWVVCNGLDTIEDWDEAVYRQGRLYCECAGTRVDQFLWDNRYEFEKEYKNGSIEVVRGRFGEMLSACVRAGFDMAVTPSAGVLGFTVGDLRGAFDGALPDWVTNFFEPPLPAHVPNTEGVWL